MGAGGHRRKASESSGGIRELANYEEGKRLLNARPKNGTEQELGRESLEGRGLTAPRIKQKRLNINQGGEILQEEGRKDEPLLRCDEGQPGSIKKSIEAEHH